MSTNRFYQKGGNGQVFGVNGLLRFAKLYTLNFEINKSWILEPNADWIDTQDEINGKTVALDGEKEGDGLFFSLRRNTRNWNTDFYYAQYSPLRNPFGLCESKQYSQHGAKP